MKPLLYMVIYSKVSTALLPTINVLSEGMASQHLQLAPLQTIDIWPIFSDHYSSCCVLVVDHGRTLDVSKIPLPFLFSRDGGPKSFPQSISSERKRYPPRLLHGVVSVKCLLVMMSLWPASDANPDLFLNLIDHRSNWGWLQDIFPQTYAIIAARNDDPASWLDHKFLENINLRHWPQIFVLHDYNSPMVQRCATKFKISFLCWYCRAKLEDFYGQMSLDVIESFCCAEQQNCGHMLAHMMDVSVIDHGAHFWHLEEPLASSDIHPNVNPFARTGGASMKVAIPGFLYGKNESIPVPRSTLYFPQFGKIAFTSLGMEPAGSFRHDFQPVEFTPHLKFITLDGVFDMKSSYGVYLAPFIPAVWFTFAVVALMSFICEVYIFGAM